MFWWLLLVLAYFCSRTARKLINALVIVGALVALLLAWALVLGSILNP